MFLIKEKHKKNRTTTSVSKNTETKLVFHKNNYHANFIYQMKNFHLLWKLLIGTELKYLLLYELHPHQNGHCSIHISKCKTFQFPNTCPFSRMQHTNSPNKLTWFSRLLVKTWESCTCAKIHLRGGVKQVTVVTVRITLCKWIFTILGLIVICCYGDTSDGHESITFVNR